MLTYLLSAFVLMMSYGVTISHTYCSKGEQWVIGAEVPPCKYTSKPKTCPYSAKKCDKNSEKNNKKRQTDTFDLRFKFIGNKVVSQETKFIAFSPVFILTPTTNGVTLFSDFPKNLSRSHLYPDLFNPDLAQLQAFRI